MKCKNCNSENTEVKSVLRRGRKTVWVIDCNSCGEVSKYIGKPDDDDDDEKEYAAPDENWQWQPD